MDENSYLLQHALGKLEKLQETATEIRLDQADIKADIREHIRRTNLLEAKVEMMKKEVDIITAPFRAICWILRLLKLLK